MPKCSFAPQKEHRRTLELYKYIICEMKMQNLRQEDLAKILHIKQTTVSHHLKHYSFDKDQLNEILDHLGIEVTICGKSF